MNKHLHIAAVVCLVLAGFSLNAQTGIGRWRDHFSYNTHSGDISLVNRSSVSGIEWMDNKLVFSDTPLGEVARQLSHAMDVRVSLDPALSRLRFSGTFENRDMDTILSYIEQTCGVRSHKNAGEIILTKK